jgi:GAF domain-containing protein
MEAPSTPRKIFRPATKIVLLLRRFVITSFIYEVMKPTVPFGIAYTGLKAGTDTDGWMVPAFVAFLIMEVLLWYLGKGEEGTQAEQTKTLSRLVSVHVQRLNKSKLEIAGVLRATVRGLCEGKPDELRGRQEKVLDLTAQHLGAVLDIQPDKFLCVWSIPNLEGNQLEEHTRHPYYGKLGAPVALTDNDDPIGLAYRTQAPQVLKSERYKRLHSAGPGFRSMLCVPAEYEGRSLGVLVVHCQRILHLEHEQLVADYVQFLGLLETLKRVNGA